MLNKLLALIDRLGQKSQILIDYLLINKDRSGVIVSLLTDLLGTKSDEGEVLAVEVIAAGREYGICTGDMQEVLASLPE